MDARLLMACKRTCFKCARRARSCASFICDQDGLGTGARTPDGELDGTGVAVSSALDEQVDGGSGRARFGGVFSSVPSLERSRVSRQRLWPHAGARGASAAGRAGGGATDPVFCGGALTSNSGTRSTSTNLKRDCVRLGHVPCSTDRETRLRGYQRSARGTRGVVNHVMILASSVGAEDLATGKWHGPLVIGDGVVRSQ